MTTCDAPKKNARRSSPAYLFAAYARVGLPSPRGIPSVPRHPSVNVPHFVAPIPSRLGQPNTLSCEHVWGSPAASAVTQLPPYPRTQKRRLRR